MVITSPLMTAEDLRCAEPPNRETLSVTVPAISTEPAHDHDIAMHRAVFFQFGRAAHDHQVAIEILVGAQV